MTESIEEVEEATKTDAEAEDRPEIVEEEDRMEDDRGFMDNIGLERLFQTRIGRTVRKPRYLKEYVVQIWRIWVSCIKLLIYP